MSSLQRQEDTGGMSDKVFSAFQRLTLETTGIELASSKRAMLLTRFNRRLKALRLDSYEEYLSLIQQAGHPERIEFIDTVTTNLTYFFREPHHFKVMEQKVFPQLEKNGNSSAPVRIWSAACSSGQEPYSIAITAHKSGITSKRPVRIMCTDIHTKLVRQTQKGEYSKDELRGLSDEQREQWFSQSANGLWQADQALRSLLLCKQLNLFGPWPIRPGVDVIICRNVLIYFDQERQTKLIHGFAKVQNAGSYLFLGHSETMKDSDKLYRRVDNTVYERL
jgi:chemotaxis protein methyltransferase CheR